MTRAEAWALRLLPYHFGIERVPGNMNVADVLSRLICKSQVDDAFDEDNEKHILYSLDAGDMSISWTEIQTASETDEELEAVRAIKAAHRGHVGCEATKRILREFFWWPNMAKQAALFVSNCEICLVISKRNPPIPLSSRQLPDGPWEILQIDFLSLRGYGSGEFLLTVDTYSPYLHVSEMKQTDARSTNAALCRVFSVWGLPLIIQSDNGPPFQGSEFIEYWESK
ncbi:uncharacterized protein K02A2.6-like [Anopheles merus]|uniref:uncharacterized protein K02A2.6-like n=1 Tax=Anopheles merus TaxID=30066 RepID=UPI001BE3E323|nr:uncharacterized protein K02A2.6-like [Anopheles merus]